MIKLIPPVKDIYVTQPFGVNYYNFYNKLGLSGHNGIDFRTKRGCPVIAAHDGVITWAGKDGDGGIGVTIWNSANSIKTIYYHLLNVNVKKTQKVKQGDLIGHADNTGIYTTADHLHFGLKQTDKNGNTININNGYRGAINPAKFFPKDWDKTPAYKRYGIKKNYLAEFWLMFAPVYARNKWADSGRYIHKRLKKIGGFKKHLSVEENNAIIYGGWGLDEVLNPALKNTWAYRKKYNDNKQNIFKR